MENSFRSLSQRHSFLRRVVIPEYDPRRILDITGYIRETWWNIYLSYTVPCFRPFVSLYCVRLLEPLRVIRTLYSVHYVLIGQWYEFVSCILRLSQLVYHNRNHNGLQNIVIGTNRTFFLKTDKCLERLRLKISSFFLLKLIIYCFKLWPGR